MDVVRQYALANDGILAGDDPALDASETGNDLELKREAEERKLHRMPKVHKFLEMWQGSQNLRTTEKESPVQNNQMTSIGYISDMEESVKPSCSLFHHDGWAGFELLERSPLPRAVSAKKLAGRQTEVLNVRRIRRMDSHSAGSDKHTAPESISDTEKLLDCNGDLDNPNGSEDDFERDNESDVNVDNCFKDPECPEERDVCAAPNVPGLIRPTQRSKKKIEKVLVSVNATETRRIRGNRQK